jgi:hypothetical protein
MVSDFLFQGSAPTSFTSSVQERQDSPQWYQAARQQLITRASQIAGEPYQPFTGPRIASQNADQLAGQNMVRSTVASGNPYTTDAAALINKRAQGFNQTEFDKYMNPYSGGMMDELTRQATRNLNENLLPQVNDTFTGAGMFGSTRHGDFAGRALRDTQESLLGQQAQVLNTNYNNAMTSYQSDLDRAGVAGGQLGALGQMIFNQGIAGASALDTIGKGQQDLTQRSLDTAYNDFLEQRDAPLRNLEIMSGTINAYTPQTQNYRYGTTALPAGQTTASPLSQVLSTAEKYNQQGGFG